MSDIMKKPLGFSRKSALLILAGIFLGGFALVRGVLDYQLYNSPFDEIDYAPKADEGFLPLLSAEVLDSQSPADAPVLDLAGGRLEQVSPRRPDTEVKVEEDSESSKDQASAPVLSDWESQVASIGEDNDPAGARSAVQASNTGQTWTPETISIPSIQVRAPIVPVPHTEIEYKNQIFKQWLAPNFYAAGWHNTTASLGVPGNTVLNGHHNAFDEVFRDLIEVQEGDLIYITSGDRIYTYQVGLKLLLNERFQPVDDRLANAQWILPSQDERLTLITCWPYESNTHRVILVAIPTDTERLSSTPE